MKTKTYLARSDTDAQGLHDGTVTEIVIPLDPQPRNGPPRTWNPDTHAITWIQWDDVHLPYEERREVAPELLSLCSGSPEAFAASVVEYSPYRPGDRIAVKERWKQGRSNDSVIHYLDQTAIEHIRPPHTRAVDRGCWRMAKYMPLWAVRTHLLCESVEAREIDDKWCWIVKVKKEQP